MSRSIRIKLIDKVDVVRKRVNKAIAEKVNATLMKKRQIITNKLRVMVRRWVSSHLEYEDENGRNDENRRDG